MKTELCCLAIFILTFCLAVCLWAIIFVDVLGIRLIALYFCVRCFCFMIYIVCKICCKFREYIAKHYENLNTIWVGADRHFLALDDTARDDNLRSCVWVSNASNNSWFQNDY